MLKMLYEGVMAMILMGIVYEWVFFVLAVFLLESIIDYLG